MERYRAKVKRRCLTVKAPSSQVTEYVGHWIKEWFPEGLLILDVEPLLMPWGAAGTGLEVAQALEHLPNEVKNRVWLVTNSAKYQTAKDCPLIGAARKPFTTLPAAVTQHTTAVVGDSLTTDGLLALRLGVPFVHLRFTGLQKPYVVLCEYLIGQLLYPNASNFCHKTLLATIYRKLVNLKGAKTWRP